jgi:hypothetical protein
MKRCLPKYAHAYFLQAFPLFRRSHCLNIYLYTAYKPNRTIYLHSFKDTQHATSYFSCCLHCASRLLVPTKVKLDGHRRFLFYPKDGSCRFLKMVLNFYHVTVLLVNRRLITSVDWTTACYTCIWSSRHAKCHVFHVLYRIFRCFE